MTSREEERDEDALEVQETLSGLAEDTQEEGAALAESAQEAGASLPARAQETAASLAKKAMDSAAVGWARAIALGVRDTAQDVLEEGRKGARSKQSQMWEKFDGKTKGRRDK